MPHLLRRDLPGQVVDLAFSIAGQVVQFERVQSCSGEQSGARADGGGEESLLAQHPDALVICLELASLS